jgi:2-alkenal reductase
VPTAGIGVLVLPEEIATRLGVKGVPIADTVPNSPAAEAGITGMDRTRGRLGDVITRVNGKPVANLAEMASALEETGIGNRAELTVLRNGRIRKVSVRVIDISQSQARR